MCHTSAAKYGWAGSVTELLVVGTLTYGVGLQVLRQVCSSSVQLCTAACDSCSSVHKL
jgi:hypothetical protein